MPNAWRINPTVKAAKKTMYLFIFCIHEHVEKTIVVYKFIFYMPHFTAAAAQNTHSHSHTHTNTPMYIFAFL